MKIFVLGCGGVGIAVASLFAKEKEVEKLIVGDMDLVSAGSLAEALKRLGLAMEIEAIEIDGSRKEDVVLAAEGTDLVYNATFPQFNIPILKACIEVGASYLDALAFPPLPWIPEEETIPAMLALDGDAKSAGITAITGVGIAPGYSNIAANYIINQMDSAEKVRFKWFNYVEANDLVSTWSPVALMEEFLNGPHPVKYENGEYKKVDLLREAEAYEFPEPIGKRTVYAATFHPEIYMVPTFLPDGKGKSIKSVDMMGGMDIGELTMKDVIIEALLRLTRKPEFKKPIKGPADMFEALGSSFYAPSNFKEAFDKGIIKDDYNTTCVEVTGRKNGKKIKHTMCYTTLFSDSKKLTPLSSVVSYATAQPGVIIGLMILRGEIDRKGFMTPDQLAQPEIFLKRLGADVNLITEKIERIVF
ncbi:MAG: saccharopine dehydrogenase NADP-binding domain-containing protein [Deltaproteobacteria bacterium]|nr:saccharopine dehydrogenase NADP-binding domain-containing protein [Deltaproteobacteria bacterium]